jgi:hypothetical protein
MEVTCAELSRYRTLEYALCLRKEHVLKFVMIWEGVLSTLCLILLSEVKLMQACTTPIVAVKLVALLLCVPELRV